MDNKLDIVAIGESLIEFLQMLKCLPQDVYINIMAVMRLLLPYLRSVWGQE